MLNHSHPVGKKKCFGVYLGILTAIQWEAWKNNPAGQETISCTLFTVMICKTHRFFFFKSSIKSWKAPLKVLPWEYCTYSAPLGLCRTGPRTADGHPQVLSLCGSDQGDTVNMTRISKRRREQNSEWNFRKKLMEEWCFLTLPQRKT